MPSDEVGAPGEIDPSLRAPLAEVFTSIQGEALFAGLQQIFVRFRGCDLNCPWCDTPAAHELEGDCRCRTRPGGRGWSIANPVSLAEVEDAVRRIIAANEPTAIHSISITGGEPLLYPEFVAGLAATLQPLHLPIMLETNGQRPRELQQVLRYIDWVAADYKLDSAMGHPLDAEARAEFLRVAQRKRAFVKIVLTDAATDEELEQAFALIASVDAGCPLFLQPVTPRGGARPPRGIDLMRFRAMATRSLRDVRIMPQIHKLLNLP